MRLVLFALCCLAVLAQGCSKEAPPETKTAPQRKLLKPGEKPSPPAPRS